MKINIINNSLINKFINHFDEIEKLIPQEIIYQTKLNVLWTGMLSTVKFYFKKTS